MIFESHAHYDDDKFNKDRVMLLDTLPSKGIEYVINVGADMESSRISVALAKEYDYIYATVGVHPHEVKNMKEEDIIELENLSKENKVIAIGEIGLDYYYDHSPRETQKHWFKRQLDLTKKLKLPAIIHSRDAAKDTFDILKSLEIHEIGGVIHCYSGSVNIAIEYSKLGYYLGIGGVITFNKAKNLKEVVKAISLDNILIETDCPYLAPTPNRGKRNDSTNLVYIAREIANIKGITYEEVVEKTKENGMKLFSI